MAMSIHPFRGRDVPDGGEVTSTTGVRGGADEIDASDRIRDADIVLFVLALDEGVTSQDRDILEEIRDRNVIMVFNKKDCVDERIVTRAREQQATSTPFGDSSPVAVIRECLARHRGDREKTARELGVHRSTLWRKMRRHGIRYP